MVKYNAAAGLMIATSIAISGIGCASANDVVPSTSSTVSFPTMEAMKRNLDDSIPEGISFLCILGFGSFVGPTDISYTDTSQPVWDYSADQTVFDAYDSQCKSLGGQTVTTTIVYDGCASAIPFPLTSIKDYASCLPPTCVTSQDQIDAYVAGYLLPNFLTGAFSSTGVDITQTAGCSVTSTSSTYGDGPDSSFDLPSIDVKCIEDTALILTNVYDKRSDDESVDEDLCKSNGGLIVDADFKRADSTCTESDVLGVKACVPTSCATDADAEAAHNYVLTFEEKCDITTLSINDGSSVGTSVQSSFLVMCTIFALTMMVVRD